MTEQKKPVPPAPATPPAPEANTAPSYAHTFVAPNFERAPAKYKSQVPKWNKASDDAVKAERIEDLILSLPDFQGVQEESKSVQILQKFLEKIGPLINVGSTAQGILSTYADIEVNAEKIGHLLHRNPYYEFQFLKVIQSVKKSADVPKAEVALILLGMQNSRNILISMQLLRAVKGTHVEWKDGKLQVNSKDILKYALKLEDALVAKKVPFSEVSFNAGVLFDLISLIAEELVEDKKKIAGFIETVFNHGVKTAEIALEISKSVPDFQMKKYLYSACVLHDMGKLIHAILDLSYLDFNEEVTAKGIPRGLRHYAEIKRFGVSHPTLSSLVCTHFDFFKTIESVLLYQHEPYLLKSKSHYQLGALVCMATNVANRFTKAKDVQDPILSEWKGLELVHFKYDPQTLVNVVGKIAK